MQAISLPVCFLLQRSSHSFTMILITGTGRCGTGYIAQVLMSVGVGCTHEGVFNQNGLEHALECIRLRHTYPEWGWRADSSWLAAPFLDRPELSDLTVVHLVRHPKKVIDSNLRIMFYTHPKYGDYFNWMRDYIPEIDEYATPEEKAAYWYIKLNELTAQRADTFHRVEDDPRLLLDKLGIEHKDKEIYADTSYNSRPGFGPSDVDLETLPDSLRERLFELTLRYGYDWPVRTQPPADEPERWLFSVFGNTLFGVHMLQSWADLVAWEKFLAAHGHELNSIVELGTGCGGMSIFLLLHAAKRNLEFRTYDVACNPALDNSAAQKVGLRDHFSQLSVLDGEFQLPDLPHPMLVLCDNGNKPQEMKHIVPQLQQGDYVAAHDWSTEIKAKDVEDLPIESVFESECERVRSVTRFWRVV